MDNILHNRRRITSSVIAILAVAVVGTFALLGSSATGEPARAIPAAERPLADSGVAAFQRARKSSDILPTRMRDAIRASALELGKDADAVDFAHSRRLTSRVANKDATVYLIPGSSANAEACIVQVTEDGYTYGCGPQDARLDQSTLRAGLLSLGSSGEWRYWGLAPQNVRDVTLVLASGERLAASVQDDVFAVDTSERPARLEWTDSSGLRHEGSLTLPPSPPTS